LRGLTGSTSYGNHPVRRAIFTTKSWNEGGTYNTKNRRAVLREWLAPHRMTPELWHAKVGGPVAIATSLA
jgi:hypothetical protein